ncbi:MAG: class I SAM-dependent methyltransferase [Anaerolineales bacterium]
MKAEALVTDETERVQRVYDQFAASYDGWMQLFDRWLVGDGRRRVVSQARGQTLEIAIGTGLNLAFYPDSVQLTGIDLTPAMLVIARQRAQQLSLNVELLLGDAQALGFPDEHFDTVVCTLALCTIPDERRALEEAFRVLRLGGQLLLLEHVRSPVGPGRWAEWVLDPLLVRLAGDHLLRDPLDHLEAAGFSIERCTHSKWGFIEEVVARKQSGKLL